MAGYVATKYLDIEAMPGANSYPGTVDLNDPNSHLNVREEPSTSASIIGKLNDGDKVTVYFDRKVPKGWSKISF
ncbi:SH3 domain-containing protein [Tepidibacter mesophilus]|uniref:SH3 domain-containing protein n=1 Tax=Tepidibacter mesophilus TaxID=655607 RepID=UPI0016511FB9|nr:SH3 domain-containing protein [Tepidibacter mesophilus]